jgi:hypothetical protein
MKKSTNPESVNGNLGGVATETQQIAYHNPIAKAAMMRFINNFTQPAGDQDTNDILEEEHAQKAINSLLDQQESWDMLYAYRMEEHGISVESMANNERFVRQEIDTYIERLADLKKYEDTLSEHNKVPSKTRSMYHSHGLSLRDLTPFSDVDDQLMQQILQVPEIQARFLSQVDIQWFGTMLLKGSSHYLSSDDTLGEGEGTRLSKETQEGAELLKQLGFDFSKSEDRLEILFKSTPDDRLPALQNNLNKLGFINEKLVDEMWQAKAEDMIEQTKQRLKDKDTTYVYYVVSPPISPELTPSADNKMANFYRSNSSLEGPGGYATIYRDGYGRDALADAFHLAEDIILSLGYKGNVTQIDDFFDADLLPTTRFAEDAYNCGAQRLDSHDAHVILGLTRMPELITMLPPTKQRVIEALAQANKSGVEAVVLQIIADHEEALCFDEAGSKPELWQEFFSSGRFKFLLDQPEEVKEKMQLDPDQATTLKLFQEMSDDQLRKLLVSTSTGYGKQTLNQKQLASFRILDQNLSKFPLVGDLLSNQVTVKHILSSENIAQTMRDLERKYRALNKEVSALSREQSSENTFVNQLETEKDDPVEQALLAKLLRFDVAQWGNKSTEQMIDIARRYKIAKQEGVIRELPASYLNPSEIVEVRELREQPFEWSKNSLDQFYTLFFDIENAQTTLQFNRPLHQLVDALADKIPVQIAQLQAKLDNPNLHTNRKQAHERDIQTLQALITEQPLGKSGHTTIPLHSVKNFQQNFGILASGKYPELAPAIRQIIFAWALHKQRNNVGNIVDALKDDNTPQIDKMRNMREFIEHIVNQETFSTYFTEQKQTKQFERLTSVDSINTAISSFENAKTDRGSTTQLQFEPTNGILQEFSGYLCDACWAGGKATYEVRPNMFTVIIKQNPGKETEKIAGASCIIETINEATGDPVLMIRGLNPLENTINNIDTSQFFDQFVGYVQQLAAARSQETGRQVEVAIAVDDHSGGATTNRPGLFKHIEAQKGQWREIPVPNDGELGVEFNGYNSSDFQTMVIPMRRL